MLLATSVSILFTLQLYLNTKNFFLQNAEKSGCAPTKSIIGRKTKHVCRCQKRSVKKNCPTFNINNFGYVKRLQRRHLICHVGEKAQDPSLLSVFHDATVMDVEPDHFSQRWLKWSRRLAVQRYYVSRWLQSGCRNGFFFLSVWRNSSSFFTALLHFTRT